MPKIPHQAQRTVLPSGGTGTGATANARQIAGKVTGIQSFGAALTGGAEQLGAAFQHAAHERDKIEAHMRSLEAQTGSQTISLVAQSKMDADMEDLTEQVRKQGGSNPEGWQVKGKDANGEETLFAPNDGAEAAITSTYSAALKHARDNYGAEGEARVAAELQNHALRNLSKFRSDHLKLRYDKLTADIDSNSEFYATRAADITRPEEMRKSDIKTMDGLLDSAVRKGALTQEEANKRQTALHAGIADKYYSADAAANPVAFLEKSAGWTGHAEPSEAGGETFVTQQKLPEGMDATKLQHYQNIAMGSLAREQAKTDRVEKAYAKRIKEHQDKTYSDDLEEVLAGGSVAGKLPQQLHEAELSPEHANTLRVVEHQLKVQNANDPVLIRQSALSRIDFSRSITKAMFGEGHLETITDQMMAEVTGGRMVPTDVEPLMTEIRTARTHLASEENQKANEQTRTAHANVMRSLVVTGSQGYDAVQQQAQEGADKDFWFERNRNPNKPAWEIADMVSKRWKPMVEERQTVLGRTEKAAFDDAKAQSLVDRGAMSKAAYKEYKEQSESWKKVYSRALEQQKHPLPAPGIMERLGEMGQSVREFGSSLFEEKSTEANP